MDVNRFNQILIVDSIPTGEFNTAKRLVEDLETYAAAYFPSPAVHYVRVESGDDFIEQISKSQKNVEEIDIVPFCCTSNVMVMRMDFSSQMVRLPIGRN